MKKKYWRYLLVLILFIVIAGQKQTKTTPSQSPTPTIQSTLVPTSVLGATDSPASGSAVEKNRVQVILIKVVDGDTVQVAINGARETIRIIGINTPETVDRRRPVECFGKEASEKAKSLLLAAKSIELEQDLSQNDRDKYKRLLRYIFIDGLDYGKQIISEGYAYEYTYEIPYRYQLDYKEAQKEAQDNKKGLWGDSACTNIQSSTSHAEFISASPTSQTLKQVQGDQSNYSDDLSGDRDCKDFATHDQAQAYFKAKDGSPTYNADKLDSDGDGESCENLP